jgi:hypothetical protein
LEPEYTPWLGTPDPAQLFVTIGDGGFGGEVINPGTSKPDGDDGGGPATTPTDEPVAVTTITTIITVDLPTSTPKLASTVTITETVGGPNTTLKPSLLHHCFTAHLLIPTQVGGDGDTLRIWDNGNRSTCNPKNRGVSLMSDNTVLEWNCDGGGYFAVTLFGKKPIEYHAWAGWKIKPTLKDYDNMVYKRRTSNAEDFESVYTGGDCLTCTTAERRDFRSYCNWEPSCDS